MLRNAKKTKEPKEHYGMLKNPKELSRMLRNAKKPKETMEC